jgi:hypothetical protein
MVTIIATCKNGGIQLEQPLSPDWEGKQVLVRIEELRSQPHKRRQSGSAKGQIWMSSDLDESFDLEEVDRPC